MSPIPEREVFRGRRSCLLPYNRSSIVLTKLRKPEAVKCLGVRIDISIRVDSDSWCGNYRARRNSDPIGKCEWTKCETTQPH